MVLGKREARVPPFGLGQECQRGGWRTPTSDTQHMPAHTWQPARPCDDAALSFPPQLLPILQGLFLTLTPTLSPPSPPASTSHTHHSQPSFPLAGGHARLIPLHRSQLCHTARCPFSFVAPSPSFRRVLRVTRNHGICIKIHITVNIWRCDIPMMLLL